MPTGFPSLGNLLFAQGLGSQNGFWRLGVKIEDTDGGGQLQPPARTNPFQLPLCTLPIATRTDQAE
ncbi:hypothetical protein C660_06714 [Alcaligenes sp. HPC1271]|nr:hypothetical protein C660_06714 [Alcaligenes sp. HPC1271]